MSFCIFACAFFSIRALCLFHTTYLQELTSTHRSHLALPWLVKGVGDPLNQPPGNERAFEGDMWRSCFCLLVVLLLLHLHRTFWPVGLSRADCCACHHNKQIYTMQGLRNKESRPCCLLESNSLSQQHPAHSCQHITY